MKKDTKERLFEIMGKIDSTFKPKLNEEYYGNTDYDTYQEPYGSFNPEEHPKLPTHEYKPSDREGFTNNIPNKEIENFFNLNLRDSDAYSGMDNISFDEMKDEVFSIMNSFGTSNLKDLQDIFNKMEYS